VISEFVRNVRTANASTDYTSSLYYAFTTQCQSMDWSSITASVTNAILQAETLKTISVYHLGPFLYPAVADRVYHFMVLCSSYDFL
jgi:hypothetical protein